jgi:methylglutaconyl-CoA hydratase
MEDPEEIVKLHASATGVAMVILDRPGVHNALDAIAIERLYDIFVDLATQDGVHVVLLKARGQSFCAGVDLDHMRRMTGFDIEQNKRDTQAMADMLQALYRLPKPTIALIQGPAFAAGVGLIAACDIAYAVRSATFSLPEIKLGLIPALISPYVIGAIGARQARRYFLTGERFDAETALKIGLVHGLAADADALSQAGERAIGAVLHAAPGALAEAKALIAAVAGRAIDEHLVAETARRLVERRLSDEAQEGIAAFLEKRRPAWMLPRA